MTIIINLLSGPGSGKSTTAAALFVRMKLAGYKVELVTEYAKDLVYADRKAVLESNQLYILAKQNYRLANLAGKVDYVITDTSLLLSNVYPEFYGQYVSDTFKELVLETYANYDNISFFIDRPDHFEEFGRTQNESESHELDEMILNTLEDVDETYVRVKADPNAIDTIMKYLSDHDIIK